MGDVLLFITLFGCITGIIIFIAARRHKERLEMIKKGKFPDMHAPTPQKTGSISLFLGLFAFGVGLALLLSAVLVQNSDRDMITVSLLFLFGGGAMLLYWRLTAKDREYARRINEELRVKYAETHRITDNKQETSESAGVDEPVSDQ